MYAAREAYGASSNGYRNHQQLVRLTYRLILVDEDLWQDSFYALMSDEFVCLKKELLLAEANKFAYSKKEFIEDGKKQNKPYLSSSPTAMDAASLTYKDEQRS
ncbi:hypothetical protein HAX54_036140 [Datura stramonium]|uniref:Four helix bundle protein n=1 Tax=Datura stramonium TaxID=4076 RepID=A0ABS8VHM3_DATST|nr:hypothetical protein [Datura stramonium]